MAGASSWAVRRSAPPRRRTRSAACPPRARAFSRWRSSSARGALEAGGGDLQDGSLLLEVRYDFLKTPGVGSDHDGGGRRARFDDVRAPAGLGMKERPRTATWHQA